MTLYSEMPKVSNVYIEKLCLSVVNENTRNAFLNGIFFFKKTDEYNYNHYLLKKKRTLLEKSKL